MKLNNVKKLSLSPLVALALFAGSLNASELQSQHVGQEDMKSAIVKLIQKVQDIEKEIAILKDKENSENLSEITNSNTVVVDEVQDSNIEISQEKVEPATVLKPIIIEDSQEEVNKKYESKEVKGSYSDYRYDKTFTVSVDALEEYEMPVLSANKVNRGMLTKGTQFVADKYTKAGWVHVKDGGWVRGFLIYPRVFQE